LATVLDPQACDSLSRAEWGVRG